MSQALSYEQFLAAKLHYGAASGFEPLWLPSSLYPFQEFLTSWAIRKGRGAVFADCGLGKTLQELTWAENIVRHTNRPVLLMAGPALYYSALGFGDYASTRYALTVPGVREANPLWQSDAKRIASQAGFVAVMTLLDVAARSESAWVRWALRGVALTIKGFAIGWNLRTYHHARRGR